MNDLFPVDEVTILDDPQDAAILRQITAFYYFKKKGLEVVDKVYPDLVPFVQENSSRSYDEVKAALFARFQF